MVFPQTVLPMLVELYVGGTWVTLPVYRRGMVNIHRGRSDESSQVDRSTLTFDLNNRSGNFSPRNPNSIYYGQIGRNTPIRVSLAGSDTYLELPGDTASKATAPDSASLSVTGDIDIRIEVTLDDWRKTTGADFCGKFNITSNQRSWAFWMSPFTAGRLGYIWSSTGNAIVSVTSTVSVPTPRSGRMALRVTHDVNNGAGGNTVTFYYADSIDGVWLQLGDPVVSGGTTSIFDSTASIELGDVANITTVPVTGRIHRFELRNGIGGTVVANPNFTAATPGATSLVDTASSPNTWTLAGSAELTNRIYRFNGEVSAWPQRWDTTGTDVHVPVEASGIIQRMGNSSDALQSVMYRGLVFDSSGLVAYWPMEDVVGSTSLAAALDTHQPLSISNGTPTLSEYEGFVSSFPLPVLNNAALSGAAPSYVVGNETQVRWLMAVPLAGGDNNQTLVMFYTTGSVRRWEINYTTAGSGSLTLLAYDGSNTQILTSGAIPYAVNGKNLLVSIELTQSGANIGWNVVTLEPGEVSGLSTSGTLNSNTVGKVGIIVISPGGGILTTTIGHLSIQNVVTSIFELASQINGWIGETAGRRIQRLCGEAGVTFRAIGDLDDTVTLGAQQPNSILALIREAAAADLGVLYEPRETFGLGYRTRASLYNQIPQVSLDYSAHNLANSLDPTDDDQSVANDVTATRPSGSSARSVLETGALSILTPPLGIGRYSKSDSVTVEHDAQLADQSRWRLALGTVDEARYPQIPLNLAHRSIAEDATLPGAIKFLELGDRLAISHLPAQLPPEDLSLLVQGYTEILGNFEHTMTLNCSPESPYRTGVYGSGNLAINGHFEVDTSGWSAITNSGIARVTSTAFAGTASLQITRTATNPPNQIHGAICNDVDRGVAVGLVCVVEFYVRIPSTAFAKVTALSVQATGIAQTTITKPSVADTWTRCYLPFVALTATLDDVQVQFWTDGTFTNGSTVAQIDAFSIRLARETAEIDRWQPEASSLSSSATSSATTLSVATPLGPLWTTDDDEFPFDIFVAGERMTVVDIAGSSSPQTFTVVRSINGIIKSHSSGEAVTLFRQSCYGL